MQIPLKKPSFEDKNSVSSFIMRNVKQLLDQPNYFIRLLFLGQQKYFEAGFCFRVENTALIGIFNAYLAAFLLDMFGVVVYYSFCVCDYGFRCRDT